MRFPPDLDIEYELRLDEVLDALGWTQSMLAGKMAVNRQWINDLVKNRVPVTMGTLEKLSKTTGYAAQDLLREAPRKRTAT